MSYMLEACLVFHARDSVGPVGLVQMQPPPPGVDEDRKMDTAHSLLHFKILAGVFLKSDGLH